jgi:hypothetical protein
MAKLFCKIFMRLSKALDFFAGAGVTGQSVTALYPADKAG